MYRIIPIQGRSSDFDCGMIVGTRQAGLSVSEPADILRFSHITVSRVFTQNSAGKQKNIQRRPVDKRGQKKMARVVGADRKAIIIQIMAPANRGEQKIISECTTCGT